LLGRAAADPSLGRVTFQTGRVVTFLSGVYNRHAHKPLLRNRNRVHFEVFANARGVIHTGHSIGIENPPRWRAERRLVILANTFRPSPLERPSAACQSDALTPQQPDRPNGEARSMISVISKMKWFELFMLSSALLIALVMACAFYYALVTKKRRPEGHRS
jgi:hypothetical protein